MSGPRPDDLPGSVLLFADFAARQLARRLDAGSPPGEAERGWRERVAGVLRRAEAGGPEAAAELLAAEPVLLSVFFQNVDLLYEHAYPGADAVSEAVMHAIALLEEPEPRG